MGQRVYTFKSPVDRGETIDIITKVVTILNGKYKVEGNIVTAKWRSKRYQTFLPVKFTFYVGADVVRVVTSESSCDKDVIKWEYRCVGITRVWDDFVITLTLSCPQYDFGLSSGSFHIVSAKFMTNGIEQQFHSVSFNRPSIGGAVVGGALFGDVGAIIGSGRGTTYTSGTTTSSFSNSVLVKLRYSNGLILEGELSTKSKVYNRIFVDLSELSE